MQSAAIQEPTALPPGTDARPDPADGEGGGAAGDDVPAGTPRKAAAAPAMRSDNEWLGAAHIESPCCLRCGKRVLRSRYHCSCCFCVVCSVCSAFRLPGLREMRVCSVCYRDNMLRCDEVLSRGIRTRTVTFCSDGGDDAGGSDDGSGAASSAAGGDKDGDEPWEMVELDRTQALQSSVLQIAMRPAPYTVQTATLLTKHPTRLFASWRAAYWMLDSNCGLASFSSFKVDPVHGTFATNHKPNLYIDMKACRELRVDMPPTLVGPRVTRISLTTESARVALGSASPETADAWKESLCIAGRLCFACGKPCFGSGGGGSSELSTPEGDESGGDANGGDDDADSTEHKATCVAVSCLPRLALLFHRECFKCARKGCTQDLCASSRVDLRGRSVFCVTSGVCKSERTLCSPTTASPAPTAEPGTDGGGDRGQVVTWSSATADDVEQLYSAWGQARAAAEAERTAKKRAADAELRAADDEGDEGDVSAVPAAAAPPPPLASDKGYGSADALTADRMWRVATSGISQLMDRFGDADPSEPDRHLECVEADGDTFVVAELSFLHFDFLRSVSGVSRRDYARSFAEDTSFTALTGGRSGSIVLTTADRRFVVKTIPAAERTLLPEILESYTQHLQGNRDSLLARMCGLYEVRFSSGALRGARVAYIVMCNVLHNPLDLRVHRVFDLKGSTVGRSAAGRPDSPHVDGGGAVGATGGDGEVLQTLKDMDLRQQLYVGPMRDALISQLTADARFLAKLGVMDYSLVLGIHDCDEATRARCDAFFCDRGEPPAAAAADSHGRLHVLYGYGEGEAGPAGVGPGGDAPSTRPRAVFVVGVVDTLQVWTHTKTTEAFLKSVVLGQDPVGLSAVKPNSYARRFIAALSARFSEA